jgi:preprotein translocase subunit SecE
VARDRKRAKRRRDRRGTTAGGRVEGAAVPPNRPVRADLPGALDHAGDVDEFDAALIRGAGGVTATPETDLGDERAAQPDAAVGSNGEVQEALSGPGADGGAGGGVPATRDTLSEGEIEAEAEAEGDLSEDELQELRGPSGPGGAGGGGAVAVTPEQASGAPLRGPSRAVAFLRASWAELQRVQWPDRRQVTQATAVVLGFVAIAGAYLGLADYVAKEVVEFILS